MKKFVLFAAVILFLAGMSANALTIETKSSHVVLINGTRIDSNYISQITFNDSNDTTSIALQDGKIITFRTSYNEYLQIQQACYPAENANPNYNSGGTYTTPPSVYYQSWEPYGGAYFINNRYNCPNNNTSTANHNGSCGNNNTGNNSGSSSGSHSTTLPANAIMAAPSPASTSGQLRFERQPVSLFH